MNRTGRTYLPRLQMLLVGILLGFSSSENLWAVEKGFSIVSLSSQQSTQSLQIIESFEKQVSALFPKTEFVRYSVQKTSVENNQILEEINKSKPTLMLTVGSESTDIGLRSKPDLPIVAAMILNKQILKKSPRATGVLLSFPPEVHIEYIRRFLPDVNRVATLYNPQENSQLIDKMIKTARAYDLKIDAMPVESIKQLPAVLKSLGRTADMLLGLPDKTVYSGKTAKAVLLSTFRNRIPFAGLSPPWVKAGALYSLDWDYADIGRQCSVLAWKILTGTDVKDIAVVPPEKVLYVINLRTADHMRLTINPTLVQGATKVYK